MYNLNLWFYLFAAISLLITTSAFSDGLMRIRQCLSYTGTGGQDRVMRALRLKGAKQRFYFLVFLGLAQLCAACLRDQGFLPPTAGAVALFVVGVTFVYSTILLVIIRMKCED